MSRSLRHGALLVMLTLVPASCTTTAATEVIVLVRVDPGLAPTTIEIDVRSPDGELVTSAVDTVDLDGSEATLGVRHRGGPLSPLTIEARGRIGTSVVIDRAVTSFVAGERRLLVLTLRSACVDVTCGDGTTCDVSGSCLSAVRSGESLPRFVGEGSLDAGLPRDGGPPRDAMGADPDAGEPAGDPCLISANCFSSEHCVQTTTGGHCVDLGEGSVGAFCADGGDCESGECVGIPGTSVCMDDCSTNSDCSDGLSCVANARTGYDGACLPHSMSPCTGCTERFGACVVMRTGAPVCTTGPLCLYGLRCEDGQTCSLLAQSEGGQAACRVGGACTMDDMSIDADGVERCGNTYVCTVGADDCSTDYPECLPGAAFGLSAERAGELGLCVRSL